MSEETELIKERLSIADVVGEYVKLKQTGQSMKGLCPFHHEKTPSFIVSPDRGVWHCFGCSEGGDAFSFIQKIEGIDFPASLKMLAEKAGVELKGHSPETTSRRQRLFDLLTASSRFYHAVLMGHDAGKKAKDYLSERGVKDTTMKRFMIGYAPNKWDMLSQWLLKQKFTEDEIISAGIAGRNQKGGLYDRFRGRIMFPVSDTQGRVVAFGGRIVPWHETGNEGKYVNSPETALYEKRRVVYNLGEAKGVLRSKKPCIVVEGYMDVVMLVQSGVENVVATSGTAFTDDHVKQLGRFTKVLHFAFDADAAGWKATVSATESALAAGMDVATIVIPAGNDPADLALKHPKKVVSMMEETESLISLLLGQLTSGDTTQSKDDTLHALVSLIRMVRNPIVQGKMMQDAAVALHVPEVQLVDLVAKVDVQPNSGASAQEEELPEAVVSGNDSLMEHQLLGLILLHMGLREEVFPHLEAEFFLDPASKALYNSMHRLQTQKSQFFSMKTEDVINSLSEDQVSFAEGIRGRAEELISTTSNDVPQEGRLLLRALQKRSLMSRLVDAQSELTQSGEKDRVKSLKRFQALAQELSSIE